MSASPAPTSSSTTTAPAADTSASATLARALSAFAVAPFALRGVRLVSWPCPARDAVLSFLDTALDEAMPRRRLPLHITDDRLFGGLSLSATLASGRPVRESGLLEETVGGSLLVPSAERLRPTVAGQLGACLDEQQLVVLAIDESRPDDPPDERPAPVLTDRLGLWLSLSDGSLSLPRPDRNALEAARHSLPELVVDDDQVDALVKAAIALGIRSIRAPLFAAHCARALAALDGAFEVDDDHVAEAAQLVLGPRATQLPAPPPEDTPSDDTTDNDPPPEPPPPENARDDDDDDDRGDDDNDDDENRDPASIDPSELVLDAAASGIPAGLLEGLALHPAGRGGGAGGAKGAKRKAQQRGRRVGVSQRGPGVLHVVETLRAAAPWQPLRRKQRDEGQRDEGQRDEGQRDAAPGGTDEGKAADDGILVERSDFRYHRFEDREETCVVFCVDASGSAALQRLAEAKGAVEQVLLDCYARRDQVALLAFRGETCEELLPPTRSLARVRKSLAHLAGGGATPLATGLDAALASALDARRRGQTPVVVVMSDAKGNMGRNGVRGRERAANDASDAARGFVAQGVRAIFVDTSPRKSPAAVALAAQMDARYLPLPYARALGFGELTRSLAES